MYWNVLAYIYLLRREGNLKENAARQPRFALHFTEILPQYKSHFSKYFSVHHFRAPEHAVLTSQSLHSFARFFGGGWSRGSSEEAEGRQIGKQNEYLKRKKYIFCSQRILKY